MKKKLAVLMLSTMLAVTAAGCGADGNKNVESTETVESTEAAPAQYEPVSKTFDVNAADYVKLSNYKGIEVSITGDYDVEDEDVKNYFETSFEEFGPFIMEDTSKTTIGEGDIVNVDYVGKLDGEAFEGGTAEAQIIDVSKNASADGTKYIEGFTEGLIGASVGDVVDCNVTFPEDYGNAELAGQGVVFTFTVNSIQKERSLEDVDDAFAMEQFQVETVEEMYALIMSQLEQLAERTKMDDTYTAAQEYLRENSTVEVPKDYLAARVSDYKAQFIDYYCGGDESQLESYLSTNAGKTVEQAEEEWNTGMEEKIKLEFILEVIAKAEGLELVEEEYESYIQSMVSSNQLSTEEALYEAYGYGDAEYGEKYIRQIYLDNLALELVVTNAKVTEAPAEESTESMDSTEEANAGSTEGTEQVPESTEEAE